MSKRTRPTQNERVVAYLKEFSSITPLEGMRDLGIYRLPSRIYDLRKKGYLIKSEWVDVPTRWGTTTRVKSYSLMEEQDG